MKKLISFLFTILKDKLGGKNPFSMNIDITDFCNGKCVFCGIWQHKEKKNLDVKLITQQLKKSNYLKHLKLISIGGGEPFMVPDLLVEFVHVIEKYTNPLQIRIVTNGFLPEQIQDSLGKILKDTKSSIGIKISTDGIGDVHDKIRGFPGGFKKIEKSIELIKELSKKYRRNVSITLGMTVIKENFDQIDEVFEFAKSKEINFFYKPYIRGGKYDNTNCNPDELMALDDDKINWMKNFNKELIQYQKKILSMTELIPSKYFYRYFNLYLDHSKDRIYCGAARSSFTILPNADVIPCLMIDDPLGNLYSNDFDEIWDSNNAIEFRDCHSNNRNKKMNCTCLTPCDTIPNLIVDHFPYYFF